MIEWNPYTKGYFQDPYTHLSACREESPIQLGVHKEWMLFKYKDVKEILRSKDFTITSLSEYFKARESSILEKEECPFLAKGTKKWLMYLEEKEHEQTRLLIDLALRRFNFTPIIEQAVDYCFTLNKNKSNIDIIDIATQIPLYIVEDFFGIRGQCELEKLKQFSHLLAVSQDLYISKPVYREINHAFSWAFQYFGELYKLSGGINNDNLLEILKSINLEMDFNLTDDEMISVITVVFMAALETTKDTMGVILYEMLRNPELSQFIVHSNETDLNILSEELLRFVSPLQYTVRVSKVDYKLNDFIFPKGAKLYLALASANRDPEVFKDPNQIVLKRSYNPHARVFFIILKRFKKT
jgi:hypothetical protein